MAEEKNKKENLKDVIIRNIIAALFIGAILAVIVIAVVNKFSGSY